MQSVEKGAQEQIWNRCCSATCSHHSESYSQSSQKTQLRSGRATSHFTQTDSRQTPLSTPTREGGQQPWPLSRASWQAFRYRGGSRRASWPSEKTSAPRPCHSPPLRGRFKTALILNHLQKYILLEKKTDQNKRPVRPSVHAPPCIICTLCMRGPIPYSSQPVVAARAQARVRARS